MAREKALLTRARGDIIGTIRRSYARCVSAPIGWASTSTTAPHRLPRQSPISGPAPCDGGGRSTAHCDWAPVGGNPVRRLLRVGASEGAGRVSVPAVATVG